VGDEGKIVAQVLNLSIRDSLRLKRSYRAKSVDTAVPFPYFDSLLLKRSYRDNLPHHRLTIPPFPLSKIHT
jgi:hypothetical protein